MSDQVQIAIITACSALIGIFLGAIISPFTTLLIESRKRHWEREDKRMERFLELEEKRINKIEIELLQLVELFNSIYHSIIEMNKKDDNEKEITLADYVDESEYRRQELSRKQDKIRVIIGSISNDEIEERWLGIDEECKKIINVDQELINSIEDENFLLPSELQTSFEKSIAEFLSVTHSYKVQLGNYYELST